MNCYEWRHNFTLTGMSISAEISYEDATYDPPVTVTISGTQTYPDVGPPYTRRGMRCGQGYDSFYARRNDWQGWQRFGITSFIQSGDWYPLTVSLDGTPTTPAAVFDSALDNFAVFPSGLFKPENGDDPAYVCADGIWRISTGVTKGFVRIIDESAQLLALGWFDRIGPGESIIYFKPDDYDFLTPIGIGAINYTFTPL